MKAFVIVIVALALGWLGWFLASPQSGLSDRSDLSDLADSIPPTTTLTDPAAVFEKAFWKRPTADDKILHAERREWADGAGVQKWQWFIAVKPSPELVRHLIADNAFSLTRTGWREPAAERPGWFPESADDHEVFASASGTFTLLRDRNTGLLYATDSGGGFRPGAPEPIEPLPVARAATSRLPLTPPPTPPNP